MILVLSVVFVPLIFLPIFSQCFRGLPKSTICLFFHPEDLFELFSPLCFARFFVPCFGILARFVLVLAGIPVLSEVLVAPVLSLCFGSASTLSSWLFFFPFRSPMKLSSSLLLGSLLLRFG